MLGRFGFWNNRTHYLNKMTLRDLISAYFQYYAIQAYILIAIPSIYVALTHITAIMPNLAVIALVGLIYPLAWYGLHRYVLHGKFLFRNRVTAGMWKRIHYDHHQDPHDLGILFGALYTTLPTVALVTLPIGYAFDGIGGAATGLATGLTVTCLYEFCHCIQHLAYKPKSKFLDRIKKLHMTHHFHNENGNYGITNYFWDRLFGTFYANKSDIEKSDTVFNLGYTEEEAKSFPWVARLSGGLGPATPRDRRQNVS